MECTVLDIACYIDHTLLKPEATPGHIHQLCEEARAYHFATVCVNGIYVRLCADLLQGSDVRVCAVVGFPLGATLSEVKHFEAQCAMQDGAREIDMVIPIGSLKAGLDSDLSRDIALVAQACHDQGSLLKVIIETALLTDEEKVRACLLAQAAHADYVKTSTGFSSNGATVHDVTLMRQTVGPDMGVKAAGGIRTLADAQAMISAGATRIGASSGVKIVQEAR
ncbi:MAG: deoxyribose-phosphate aldolase [Chloroflexi bacterium]|nr:deoxyribose-phosphate aldolase [Chloroflexota bacterium]